MTTRAGVPITLFLALSRPGCNSDEAHEAVPPPTVKQQKGQREGGTPGDLSEEDIFSLKNDHAGLDSRPASRDFPITVKAFDATTGEVRWVTLKAPSSVASSPLAEDGTLLFGTTVPAALGGQPGTNGVVAYRTG